MELLQAYDSDSDADASSKTEETRSLAATARAAADPLSSLPPRALPASQSLQPARSWTALQPRESIRHQPHWQRFTPSIPLHSTTRILDHVQRRRMTHEEQAFEFRGYVSKRRRRDAAAQEQSAASPAHHEQRPSPPPPLFTSEHEDDSDNSNDDEVRAKRSETPASALPTRAVCKYKGHTGAVNCVRWNAINHSSVFLSASMDGSVQLWHREHVASRRVLKLHTKGVKSAKWSLDGAHVLTGSYDGRAIFADAETGAAVQTFEPHTHSTQAHSPVAAVTSVCVHPTESHLFLAGTDRGRIVSYDVRQRAPCRTYERGFGDVLDLLFLPNATGGTDARFVSSAGVRYRDASHQTLLVWDFASSALLSDRLDRDMQPFQCLRLHPHEPRFVAQASANYALFFAATAPYKRVNKGKSRFAGGHEVEGFGVQCSFRPDGAVLATGDANGRVFLYDTVSKRVLRRVEAFSSSTTHTRASACLCAEFQPSTGTTTHQRTRLVAGSFDGQLELYE